MTTTSLEPVTVHCGKCAYERVLGYAPMPIDVFVALGKLPCVSCHSREVRMGPLPKSSNDGDHIGWLSNGDTGISSLTIWSVMTGRPVRQSYFYPDVPQDPDDFGRCYRLLAVMPSWRERLPEVAAKYPEWRPLVDAWDELTALYEASDRAGWKPPHVMYKRMRALIDRSSSLSGEAQKGSDA
jgi:hypothetical protein